MVSTSTNIIKIFIFLVINGAILDSTAMPSPSPSPLPSASPSINVTTPFPSLNETECGKNMKAECRDAVAKALCQEIEIPVEATVSDLCCEDLHSNVNATCITTAMVRDVKKHCKINKQLIKMRSNQIWMFCIDATVSPGLDELGN